MARVERVIRTASLRVYVEEASTAVRGLPEAPSNPGTPMAVGVTLTTERGWRGLRSLTSPPGILLFLLIALYSYFTDRKAGSR